MKIKSRLKRLEKKENNSRLNADSGEVRVNWIITGLDTSGMRFKQACKVRDDAMSYMSKLPNEQRLALLIANMESAIAEGTDIPHAGESLKGYREQLAQ